MSKYSAHNLKENEAFEKEMKGIEDTSDVTIVREDGKEFVVKGKAVRSHLERGFTVKGKKAGKKASPIKLDTAKKTAAKK